MFSTHSPPLLVRGLASLVPVHYFPGTCDLIVVSQVLSPASVVFSCIGILLLVSVILDVIVPAIMTLRHWHHLGG